MKKTFFLIAIFLSFINIISADTAQIVESYGKIPLAFTVNQGQTTSQVRFTAYGSGCDMFFTPAGTAFVLSRETEESVVKHAAAKTTGTPEDMETGKDSGREYESFAMKTEFVGANETADIVGEDRLSWNNNYFIGNDPAKWRTDVPNYSKVRLLDVYNGIDLVYYGNKNRMKYDFVVKPGENASKIAVKYDLGENAGKVLFINAKGQLAITTPLGEVIEDKPYCYQRINGKEVEIEISYKIIDAENNIFGFEVGKYDEGFELVIDPELVYSTFLGGSGIEYGHGIAVDNYGCAYITGATRSSDYPVTSGAYDITHNTTYEGFSNPFITKISPDGSSIVYSTFLGGSVSDYAYAIAVDNSGCVYITGGTTSSNYPVTENAYDKSYNDTDYTVGFGDTFLTKLNAEGNALVYSTYIGGTQGEIGNGIAVDDVGFAYIVGGTTSSDFPITNNSYDTHYDGDLYDGDVFISKIDTNIGGFVYSTFIGGNTYDEGYGITLDISGCAYITGNTGSSDYPVTRDAYCIKFNGVSDIFVTKINAVGNDLVFSTFIGGCCNHDIGSGIALDLSGYIYITGYTRSSDYPITIDAYDSTFNSSNIVNNKSNAIITKINPQGSSLVYSTFIGGNTYDKGNGIAVDNSGYVYIIGNTCSPDYPITSDAYDISYNDKEYVYDTYLTKLKTDGSGLIYSTFLGGSEGEDVHGIVLDNSGGVYIAGETYSSDYPITNNAFNTSFNGIYDVFITKFNFSPDTLSVYDNPKLPKSLSLSPAVPNPFNPATTISFTIPADSRVVIKVYNIVGQEVAMLKNEMMTAGSHSVVWNAKDMPSGIYFCTVKAGGFTETRKMTLLK